MPGESDVKSTDKSTGDSSHVPSIRLLRDLGSRSASPSHCPESDFRPGREAIIENTRHGSSCTAYLRRKSMEASRPTGHGEPSLPRFIETLLSTDERSESNTSADGSGSDEDSDVFAFESRRPPFRRRETPSLATTYGDSNDQQRSTPPPQSTLLPSTSTIDSTSNNIFAFSDPQYNTERDSSEIVLSNSVAGRSMSLEMENGDSWAEFCDALNLRGQSNHTAVEKTKISQPMEAPLHLGSSFQHMSSILDAVCAITTLSTTAESDDCSLPSIEILDMPQFLLQLDQSSQTSSLASIAMTLPSEIIQQIYLDLHPQDFNAARHTCRTWMHASLDTHILRLMLQRGAWWSGFERQLRATTLTVGGFEKLAAHKVWFMSCVVARECALSGSWVGNGFVRMNHNTLATCDHHRGQCQKPSCWTSRRTLIDASAFRQVAQVSFAELATGYGSAARDSSLVFTASSCGNYLLVAEGGMIYVYEMFGDELRAFANVICPRKVLAMSIDASHKRFAVAALLDGRMGLMCDLRSGSCSSTDFAAQTGVLAEGSAEYGCLSTDLTTNVCLDSARAREEVEILSDDNPETIEDDYTESGRDVAGINRAWNLHIQSTDRGSEPRNKEVANNIAIETGPRTVYHQLCGEDDPPRSVAICPQRQCVAFGCSAGLELHWIDALTGQDLNRWFPLTGPSDYLYFLPPRLGVDSPRKLRLISSAAHPHQRPAMARPFTASRLSAEPIMTNSFWGSIGFENHMPSIAGFVSDCDHYRAVPMSDGFHILFTDPDSGMLCLGSDAPVGDPRRLLRKIMLTPPMQGAIPRLYTSNFDISSGPRIVVAYHDDIFLYSIPSDPFEFSLREQQPGGTTGADMDAASLWLSWWPEDDIPANYPRPSTAPKSDPSSQSTWPLFVRGVSVGSLKSLVDLSVNTASGSISVWAFSSCGETSIWQIEKGMSHHLITRRNVARDGQVMNPYGLDADGDVVMGEGAFPMSHMVSSPDHQTDGSCTTSSLQHSHYYEQMGPRWDVGLGSGSWFGEHGEVDTTDMPVEITTCIVDDVDVYRDYTVFPCL